jgi:serine/threonine protein kinase
MSGQRYVVREILGKGGMGAVYRAWDDETRREVTLKTLLDVQDRTMLELFYKECRVLASLNHPNIVDIYDVGEMEIDGGKRPYFTKSSAHRGTGG